MARAQQALQKAVRKYMSDRNITLIELGFKEKDGQVQTDEPVIRFHVRQKLDRFDLRAAVQSGRTHAIPAQIDGIQTDVIQGTYRPQWGRAGWRRASANLRAAHADPLCGGISIANEYLRGYGTLGCPVFDRQNGSPMLLSNWHVLVKSRTLQRTPVGQRIFQPGPLDGGDSTSTIATLARTAMTSGLDAAVATLTDDRPLINFQHGLGPVAGPGQAKLGMEVVKSGRQTGITRGWVTAIGGVIKMKYSQLSGAVLIGNVVTIDPRFSFEQVSGPGDSGSLWLEEGTMQAVGLHFAGSNFPERALALDIQPVLAALDVQMLF
jgi:endonuclease G